MSLPHATKRADEQPVCQHPLRAARPLTPNPCPAATKEQAKPWQGPGGALAPPGPETPGAPEKHARQIKGVNPPKDQLANTCVAACWRPCEALGAPSPAPHTEK